MYLMTEQIKREKEEREALEQQKKINQAKALLQQSADRSLRTVVEYDSRVSRYGEEAANEGVQSAHQQNIQWAVSNGIPTDGMSKTWDRETVLNGVMSFEDMYKKVFSEDLEFGDVFNKVDLDNYDPAELGPFQESFRKGKPDVTLLPKPIDGTDATATQRVRDSRIAAGTEYGVRVLGLSEQEARDRATLAVAGFTRMDTTQQGRTRTLNVLSGTMNEVPLDSREGGNGNIGQDINEGDDLWTLADYSTGVRNWSVDKINRATALFGMEPDKIVENARQRFSMATNNFIRSNAVNRRFSSAEIDRLAKEASLDPAILDSPELLRTRMSAIQEALLVRQRQEENRAFNPRLGLSEDDRAASADMANEIENFLTIMNAPLKMSGNVEQDKELWDSLPIGRAVINPVTGKIVYKR